MYNFKNKIVVVTGAARGIGKTIASKFSEHGAITIIVDLDEHSSEDAIIEIRNKGYKAEFVNVDLRSIEGIKQFIEETFIRYGTIDVIVNNARGGSRSQPLEENEENWSTAFDVNLRAPLFISQAYIKKMRDSYHAGCIINISSVAAKLICGESASYHLTKTGIDNLTRYLAVYGGPSGIRVNAVQPGFIVQEEHQERFWSENNNNYRQAAIFAHPLRKVGKSDDVANVCLFLASDGAAFITGQVIAVDGGLAIQEQWSLVHNYLESQKHGS